MLTGLEGWHPTEEPHPRSSRNVARVGRCPRRRITHDGIKIMESTGHERVLIVTSDELLRGVASELLTTRGWLSAAFSDSQLAFQYFCGHFHEIPAVIVDGRDDVRRATDLVRRLVEVRGDVQPFVLASKAPGALLSAAFLRWLEPNDCRTATLKNVPEPAPPLEAGRRDAARISVGNEGAHRTPL